MLLRLRYLLAMLCGLAACKDRSGNGDSTSISAPTAGIPLINYSVGHIYPHDTTSYTNGIAFDPMANATFVTGKLWSAIYEIDFSH